MNRRTNIIWVIVCLSVMIVSIILGAYYHLGYVSLCGVIFCCVGLAILAFLNKFMAWREIKRELKELAEEDPKCPQNPSELVQMSFGLTKDAKNKLKSAPFVDKLKVISIFASFALLLLTMAVGVFLARLGTLGDGTITKIAIAGFICMGIGGGGFFLEIILLAVISSIKNR